MKFAKCSRDVEQVRPYLPSNYHVAEATDGKALVYGTDDHGWTMETYVIPRLGSGLIAAGQISKREFLAELKLSAGDEVFWNDPDDSLCSGRATFIGPVNDSGLTFWIKKDGVECEVYLNELSLETH